ncbi:SMAD/FHA domain-containing protein [Cadophora sp. MPI-SDFR-AT-0126]|nr:SMAD/FHA domain-containing protein [Leotiomycetes sp. MPI-SDFR-AT-0126]
MDRHSGRERERVRDRDREREKREKSRSVSYDSEEERRRRRRRERREEVVGEAGRRNEEGSGRDRHGGDRERDRKRRRTRSRSRSRSPVHESSRRSDRDRDRDRDSKHRSTRERSPYRSNNGRDKDRDKEREGSGSEKDKQKPNFAPTGLLAAASNSVTQADGSAIALKYHEPAEARKPPPRDDWKLFVFKGPEILETIDLSLRSCWLVGREVAVVDLPAEHPSVSKQHAVIQFRYIEKKNEFGDKTGRVRPYLIDLDSANGTALNKEEIPPSRYLELRDKDMIQFGHSTREYVLMLSKS